MSDNKKRLCSVHILDFNATQGKEANFRILAEIFVPGLGTVGIGDCLSKETIEKISNEVLFFLEQKMIRKI